MADTEPVNGAASSGEPSTVRRLDSWKEIAAYLRRDVATVRRWEKRESLPVHRHHHQKLGSVYAFPSELDAWWQARSLQIEQPEPFGAKTSTRNRAARLAALLCLGMAVAISGFLWMAKPAKPAAPPPPAAVTSLAVLPFEPLGDPARDEALELGMTDALITRLGNLKQIDVRPTSVVLKYAHDQSGPETAGRELDVDAVVEGKIQRAGDRIRVTVHLVRVQDGASLWAETFDEQFTNIFAVQDSISQQIARALPLSLGKDEANVLTRRETISAQAYQLYLKGRYFSGRRGQEALRTAVDYFEQAIKLDPSYALAHAALADSLASWANASIVPSREAYPKARAAALRALELDERLADGHTALGVVSLFYDWDWPAAERAFRRAITLEPDNARAHRRYSLGLMWLGRFDEAVRESQRARELAPTDLEIDANVSLVLYFARRYSDAIIEARKTLRMEDDLSQAHRTIARASMELGRFQEAIAAYHQAIASGGVQLLNAELGHAYASSGRREDALKIRDELNNLSRHQYVSPYDMAVLHIGLGDPDQAFDWLEKSYAERERWMLQLKVAPMLDPLRSDPRFGNLVRRVGLWH